MPLQLVKGSVFARIPAPGLAYLESHGVPRRFTAGSALMRQGEVADVMHVITSGQVRVERTHPDLRESVMLAELGPSEVVGEIGVLDSEPRTATVIATEDTDTLEIGAGDLARVLLDHPEVTLALLQVVSRRLRDTDSLIDEIKRKGWTA